ncbi:hypothetical protein CCMA1212_003959 [Trichoderma ghanense]|uniref:Uncharacterized protein n=1 Tax=Trichoderma ghanense TaxID=65468 RepID=A0ABY2H6Y8_9HYPO
MGVLSLSRQPCIDDRSAFGNSGCGISGASRVRFATGGPMGVRRCRELFRPGLGVGGRTNDG